MTDIRWNVPTRVVATTMARRGMFIPALPQRTIGQLRALRTWGYGLGGQLQAAAARSPGAIAVIDEAQGQVSYAGLAARSVGVARALQARGLRQGHVVGLLARNHVDAVAVIAGASLAGVDLMLLNPGLSGALVAAIAQREGLCLVVHDDDLPPAVPDATPGVWVSESELARQARAIRPGPALRPPARAGRTIMLTSGTTGAPRGAPRPQPPGPAALVSIIERIPLRVASRTLLSAPVFHTWGYSALLVCLGLRHTIVLQRRFEAARARQALAAHHCDTMIGVPVMLQRLLQLPTTGDGRPRGLRVVATSGAALPKGFATTFMDAFGDVLYSLYGSTEASWICIATPRDLRRDPDTVGTPPLGTVVKVLDDAGSEVPDGSQGRIFCGNQMVFDGYTSGEDRERVDGLVFTGDVGHVRDGLLFVDGRADDMVISGGENVYPMQVERVLAAHPSVSDVAVTGIPDAQFGQRLAAFVVVRHGERLTASDVQRYVGTQLARHCAPRDVVFVPELPRTAMGKIPQALLATLGRSR
ncbi:MAG: AMP-binding protein [Dermatophilaceae bacterium]